MKLTEESTRSYIDDIKYVELIKFLTWKGDVSPTWIGKYMPATRSDDSELVIHALFNRGHYLFYRALIERHMDKRGSALDIGCGTGQRTAMLARYADEVWGVDNDMLKISSAIHLNGAGNIKFAFSDLWQQENEDSYGRKFDYIFMVEVVEHIELVAQVSFVKLALRLLEDGGRMFITTPKDKVIARDYPHIGLWDENTVAEMVDNFGGTIEYFNVGPLNSGGENPWSEKDQATHYVMVIQK